MCQTMSHQLMRASAPYPKQDGSFVRTPSASEESSCELRGNLRRESLGAEETFEESRWAPRKVLTRPARPKALWQRLPGRAQLSNKPCFVAREHDGLLQA
jgi:hypothetical protein